LYGYISSNIQEKQLTEMQAIQGGGARPLSARPGTANSISSNPVLANKINERSTLLTGDAARQKMIRMEQSLKEKDNTLK
jgi:hypothetical protein